MVLRGFVSERLPNRNALDVFILTLLEPVYHKAIAIAASWGLISLLSMFSSVKRLSLPSNENYEVKILAFVCIACLCGNESRTLVCRLSTVTCRYFHMSNRIRQVISTHTKTVLYGFAAASKSQHRRRSGLANRIEPSSLPFVRLITFIAGHETIIDHLHHSQQTCGRNSSHWPA